MKYFYNAKEFSYQVLLESNAPTILSELTSLINDEKINNKRVNWFAAHPHYVKGSENISWKTFEFVFFGIKNIANIELCPKTYELISQIPELITAQFSVLLPNTHIKPHKGYSTIILRNHLPLIVPEGNQCGIRVGEETHYWKKNELVVFDDSFEHEAWNNSDEIRVVLMFDIAKPDCGYAANQICKYKIERIDDPFLLNIATKEQWMKWYEKGQFDSNLKKH